MGTQPGWPEATVDRMARENKLEDRMSVSTEYLTRRLDQTTEENEGLHELAGFWRESAGELKQEAEKEIERLQEMHRKNVYTIRMFRAAQFGDYEQSLVALATLLNSLEQRSMAALGAKE